MFDDRPAHTEMDIHHPVLVVRVIGQVAISDVHASGKTDLSVCHKDLAMIPKVDVD